MANIIADENFSRIFTDKVVSIDTASFPEMWKQNSINYLVSEEDFI